MITNSRWESPFWGGTRVGGAVEGALTRLSFVLFFELAREPST